MEETALLREILYRENKLGLDNYSFVKGVPLWRILRYQTRLSFIKSKLGYEALTKEPEFVGKRRVKLFSGNWKYIFKKELNVFFTFNRLSFSNGIYFDKFIDPVVEYSLLRDSNYVIYDSPNYVGDYPRIHKEHVISNERRSLLSQVFKNVSLVLTPIIYRKKILSLYNHVNKTFNLDRKYIKIFGRALSLYIADYYYCLLWFRLLRPQRVFVVFRMGYLPQIAVCKRLSIPVAEFQHGITLDNTISYTGNYDSRIDVDYFLTFGSYWDALNFGMTPDRTICIGWAYRLMTRPYDKEIHGNEILVISSPEISDAILDAITQISQWNDSIKFHIRLHPCESYNNMQELNLSRIPHAEVVDNKIDSAAVLPTYRFVIGENSSVLYEALSYGCKVGLLDMCGLRPPVEKPGIRESFFVINDEKSFVDFLSGNDETQIRKKEFYSDFNKDIFEQFLMKKM